MVIVGTETGGIESSRIESDRIEMAGTTASGSPPDTRSVRGVSRRGMVLGAEETLDSVRTGPDRAPSAGATAMETDTVGIETETGGIGRAGTGIEAERDDGEATDSSTGTTEETTDLSTGATGETMGVTTVVTEETSGSRKP